MSSIPLAVTASLGVILGAVAVVQGGTGRLRAIDATVGFGAGYLLALVLLTLIPEVVAMAGANGAGAILVGYILVLLAQQFIAPHFHFGEERHSVSRATATSAVAALAMHSFFDGVGIAAGLAVNPSLGFLVFAGVIVHKLPEGVTVTSLMVASRRGPRGLAAAVAVVALATPLGALVAPKAGSLAPIGLGLAAGAALHVAASNLVPEMESRGRKLMVVTLLLGITAFLLLDAVLGSLA